tara:strand:- start:8416 stop:9075 length:660 start_codon:yes stop_codon:yes gene_type:complete
VKENLLKTSELEIDETGAWLSIGDLMSALLMIFALLFIVALLSLQEAAEQAKNSRIVIIQSLQKNLNDEGINAKINPETGDISILDSLLFDSASSILKPAGKEFLSKFIPVYSKALFTNQQVSDEIVYVVIEGHTSSAGSNQSNMKLSLDRSQSVYDVIADMNFPEKDTFLNKILASGRGEIEANQTQDDAEDRKVLFRFQFKSERFLQWFLEQRIVGS